MEELVAQLEAELAAKMEENELLEQMVNSGGGDSAAMEALQAENAKLREQVRACPPFCGRPRCLPSQQFLVAARAPSSGPPWKLPRGIVE